MIDLIDKNFNLHANTIPEKTDSMEVQYFKGFSMVNSGLPCDTFNIIHILAQEVAFQDLSESISLLKKNNLDFCLWVNQENLTSELKSFLFSNHMNQQNEEVGMVLSMDDYETQNLDNHKNITTVENAEDLQEYANVLASNWNPSDQNVIDYYNITSEHFLESEITLFTYNHEGTISTTVELFPTDAKIAGIYGFATLEKFRGNGIGNTVMTGILNHAKTSGFEKVILQATEDGIRIYKRMGFRPYTTYYEFA